MIIENVQTFSAAWLVVNRLILADSIVFYKENKPKADNKKEIEEARKQ